MNERKHGYSSGQACASCKHQRRKCHNDCLLAPYFPAHKHEDFMNAHRLFGVANITKILNSIEPHKRSDAVKSIVIESKARKDHPVEGILGIIRHLKNQISFYENELRNVIEQLSYYRQRRHRQQIEHTLSNPIYVLPSSSLSSVPSPSLQHYYFDNHPHPQMQVASYDYSLVNLDDMNELKEESNYLPFHPEYVDVKPDIKITDDGSRKK